MSKDPRRCELCRFWLGKAGDYRSDCTNPALYASRPAFDEGTRCQGWQPKPPPAVQAGKVAITWQQMKSKGQQP